MNLRPVEHFFPHFLTGLLYTHTANQSKSEELVHPVQNSLWKKKNRASDIEGKFHTILKCRIWIYHQKLFSSLDIRDSMHFGIYLEKWAIFWLFLRSSVLATSGYTLKRRENE